MDNRKDNDFTLLQYLRINFNVLLKFKETGRVIITYDPSGVAVVSDSVGNDPNVSVRELSRNGRSCSYVTCKGVSGLKKAASELAALQRRTDPANGKYCYGRVVLWENAEFKPRDIEGVDAHVIVIDELCVFFESLENDTRTTHELLVTPKPDPALGTVLAQQLRIAGFPGEISVEDFNQVRVIMPNQTTIVGLDMLNIKF